MAKDIVMQRVANGSLVPTDQSGVEYINALKIGKPVGVTVVQARNYKFHQKIIVLLQYCFDIIPPAQVEFQGQQISMSFETFRREMVAISGHYTASATMNGNLRIEPQSISYKDCSEELAQEIYSDVLNKALSILGEHKKNYSREQLDDIVDELLRFDG